MSKRIEHVAEMDEAVRKPYYPCAEAIAFSDAWELYEWDRIQAACAARERMAALDAERASLRRAVVNATAFLLTSLVIGMLLAYLFGGH